MTEKASSTEGAQEPSRKMEGTFELFSLNAGEPFELHDDTEFISAVPEGIGTSLRVLVFHYLPKDKRRKNDATVLQKEYQQSATTPMPNRPEDEE